MLSSELVMHIVIDNYSWLSQYVLRSWFPGLGQGYLGTASCFWLIENFSLQPFHLYVWGSTKRPPSLRVLGYLYPGQMWLFQRMLSVFLKQGVSLAPCATYCTPNHPSVKQQGWLMELEPGLNFTDAISNLVAATAPARVPPEKKGPKKKKKKEKRMEREKEVRFWQKQFS